MNSNIPSCETCIYKNGYRCESGRGFRTVKYQRMSGWLACRFVHNSCGKEGRFYKPKKGTTL